MPKYELHMKYTDSHRVDFIQVTADNEEQAKAIAVGNSRLTVLDCKEAPAEAKAITAGTSYQGLLIVGRLFVFMGAVQVLAAVVSFLWFLLSRISTGYTTDASTLALMIALQSAIWVLPVLGSGFALLALRDIALNTRRRR